MTEWGGVRPKVEQVASPDILGRLLREFGTYTVLGIDRQVNNRHITELLAEASFIYKLKQIAAKIKKNNIHNKSLILFALVAVRAMVHVRRSSDRQGEHGNGNSNCII